MADSFVALPSQTAASNASVPTMITSQSLPRTNHRGLLALAVYLGAYALALWGLSGQHGFSLAEPLFVLVIMGVAFPLLAEALTGGARNETAPLVQPYRQLATALGYLTLFAVVVLGFGFSALNDVLPDEPLQSSAKLAVKLLTMFALPWLLLRSFGKEQLPALAGDFSWRRHGRSLIGLGAALLVFQAVFGRGLHSLEVLHASALTLAWAIPAGFVWLSLEAGLCEEFLFRVVLQTRLAAVLKSELGAICLGSLLFGLAHAPGLYLRGASLMEGADAHPTMLWAIAYSVAIISPAGLLFGVLWSRTRSLVLVVALHALTDLLPNLAPLIQAWSGQN
jgi:membrane protease YdiL (CAAX protease family)